MYQGKEIFKIPSNLNSIASVLDTPPFQKLQTIPQLGYLINMIDSFPNLVSLLAKMPIVFLQNVHGINRAFNSEKYNDLSAQADIELVSLKTDSYEDYLVRNVTKAYNTSLDIDYLKSILQENDLQSEQLSNDDPYAVMNSWQQSAISTITTKFNQAKTALETLLNIKKTRPLTAEENKQKVRLTWDIFDLEKIFDKLANLIGLQSRSITNIQGLTRENFPEKLDELEERINRISALILRQNRIRLNSINSLHLKPRQLTAPITGVGSAITMIHEIASFFLSFFGVPVSVNLLPALAYTATGMVLKLIGSGGAMVARYLSANILRQLTSSLPAIVQVTGMWGMAWGFLAPFAPWIILTAVIVTVGIRSQTKLADRLYLFGNTGTNAYPDSSFMVVSETNNREIYDILVSQAETMKANSGKDYSSGFLYGFSTYKNKPQYGLNLTLPDDITNLTKVQVEVIFPDNFSRFNNWLA